MVLPGPALGKMQGEAACLAGDASGEGEETSAEGLVVIIGWPRPIRVVQRAPPKADWLGSIPRGDG